MPATYRFALDSRGRICPVDSLSRQEAAVLGPFTCIDCDGNLTPKLGPKNVKHFAHASAADCGGETYLHKLGKRLFIETYSTCLQNSRPFTLGLLTKHQCVSHQERLGLSCEFERLKDYDITGHFDEILEEEPFGGFTPDVLLRSKKSGEAIFVEIAVSHPCAPEKIASGHRIIEYVLQSEDDVGILLTAGVQQGAANVNLFNFHPKSLRGSFCSDTCARGAFDCFIVDNRGNASVLSAHPGELFRELAGPNILLSSPAGPGDLEPQFRAFVLKAVRQGIAVRNCLACEFAPEDSAANPIVCRKTSRHVASSEALRCRFFARRRP